MNIQRLIKLYKTSKILRECGGDLREYFQEEIERMDGCGIISPVLLIHYCYKLQVILDYLVIYFHILRYTDTPVLLMVVQASCTRVRLRRRITVQTSYRLLDAPT